MSQAKTRRQENITAHECKNREHLPKEKKNTGNHEWIASRNC